MASEMSGNMWPDSLIAKLEDRRIVAVLVIDDVDDAVPTAEALMAGGIDIMELTLRTPAALDALEVIRNRVPEMTAGVGTILTVEECSEAFGGGAEFGVAPGFNPDVVRKALEIGLPFGPGIATPSDIEGAYQLGCGIQKIFPAEHLGGVSYLSSINAPYRHLGIRFIPLGGVNPSNLKLWLDCPEVIAVGGSWIGQRSLIQEKRWAEIERRAKEARSIAEESGRGGA